MFELVDHDLFATKFFSFQVEDKELLQSITEEVYAYKDKMKSTSWAQNNGKDVENYITDFKQPQRIEGFERAVELMQASLATIGLQYQITKYWTALYKKFSIHEMHEHQGNILQPINYSGILYLSNVGSTEFFSHNPSSFQKNVKIPSEHGKVILFPSSVPHQVMTDFDFGVERCVIAFNGIMRQ